MHKPQTEFFEKVLGAKLRNRQWSWGAFDESSNRVFLRIWEDQIYRDTKGEYVLVLGNDWNPRSNGYPERLTHIEAIERGVLGIGIICQTSDRPDAEKRTIKSFNAETLLSLGEIFRTDGNIFARIMDRFPISELNKCVSAEANQLRKQKLTRISFNSSNWQRPTGDARKYEAAGTHNHEHGFGYEDWLFRAEWQIDGWRYAFIQGVNKSHRKLVEANEPVDLTLFTIEPDKRRRYVAQIRAVECLDDNQAEAALNAFKKRGWFQLMLDEIKIAGGDIKIVGDTSWAKHILNVRFRVDNVVTFSPDVFADSNDAVMQLDRYQLYDVNSMDEKISARTTHGREGNNEPPIARSFIRRATAAVECTPEHAQLQAKLFAELKVEFPNALILCEENFVDVSVQTEKEIILFEIKSDIEPRVVIRNALGQILEYAYRFQRKDTLSLRLVIVGRCPMTSVDKGYVEFLQKEFLIPVNYRVVSL